MTETKDVAAGEKPIVIAAKVVDHVRPESVPGNATGQRLNRRSGAIR
jgi:hypothetical protein